MADNRINYNKRTFSQIRQDLYDYINQYYPETLASFSDSSIGSLLIDLCAGVGNNLSFNVDRAFQETQLDYAQQRKSIFALAKNLGFNIPSKRASVTVVDFSVTVPAKGDTFDTEYLPILKTGAQVVGGGKTFETTDDIDFSSPTSNFGTPNRIIIPNFNSNNIIQNYTITKREVVYNGSTSIFKKVVRPEDSIPFLEIILPDDDVLSIEQVIVLNGVNYNTDPALTDFFNPDNRFYEVEYLAEQKIFVENGSIGISGSSGIKAGVYLDTTKKFIKEYTDNGFCKIIFGGGNPDLNLYTEAINSVGFGSVNFLQNYLNNTALGEIPRGNTTIFIRYRTGGGSTSNVGTNTLTSTGSYTMIVNGRRDGFNRLINRSLRVNNPIPAIGGSDELSIEQIRKLITYNFSAQNRCVTIDDYLSRVYQMPGKFGAPFKLNAFKADNKVVIPIIGLGSDGKLDNSSTTILKQNIAEYLKKYRMINDYVEVRDGKIFNLAFDFTIYIDENNNQNDIANLVIRTISDYFDINTREMNEDIFIGDLVKMVNDINGVINVVSYKIYNKVGNGYSLNEIEMAYANDTTREIQLVNNTIYSVEDSMFEIKYPQRDIRIFINKRNQLLG
jgi:hypothetical protein